MPKQPQVEIVGFESLQSQGQCILTLNGLGRRHGNNFDCRKSGIVIEVAEAVRFVLAGAATVVVNTALCFTTISTLMSCTGLTFALLSLESGLRAAGAA